MSQPSLNRPDLLRTQAYVNGKWISASATFGVYNPADQGLICEVADTGEAETKQAILAAEKAFTSWKQTSAHERAQLLKRWHALQIEHAEDLARLLTLEQGKPLAEASGEIRYGAAFVEWFAEEARRAYGGIIPGHASDKRILTLRQPVGVVAAITPWNFPNAMITRKVAPALAAGCTVIVKPAEDTPLSALALAVLAEEAGIPAGVFNVLPTSRPKEVGTALMESPVVRKLSFTGSTPVGKLLMKQAADTVKRISLELGGNAPFIVFEDADLDKAVAGAIASKYRNAGQTCVCANRIYVQASVVEAFTGKLAAAVAQLSVGNGWEEGIEIGPLINKKGLEKVERLLRDARAKGATIHTGGRPHQRGGTFFEPTVLGKITAEMDLHREEIFGPIAPVYSFETEAEVLRLANDTPFGLAAYFYDKNLDRVWRVAEGLEYGMIGVNTGMVSTPVAPFGGVKESGIGREGSRHGMDEYLEIKYVCMQVEQ